MLSGEAVFMVYLQLCQFGLPARGCSRKTVPKTFRVPQPLVLSWSSDIPAQCHQPQVCLSCFRERAIKRRGIPDSWGWLLFFQACSTLSVFGGVIHARLRFSSSLAGIWTKSLIQDPLKSTKAFKWPICPMMPFLQMDRHQALLFFHYEAVCFSLQTLTHFPVGLWTLDGPFIPPNECWFFLVTFQWEGSNGSKETSDLLMSFPSWKSEPLFSRAADGLQPPEGGQAPHFSVSVKSPD